MANRIEKLDHLLTESLRAAEMRQGCTNHTYYAEIIRKQVLELFPQPLDDKELREEIKIEEARKQGRILGIKQAVAFVRRAYDNPIIASEAEKWVIPYGYKFMSAIKKANRQALKGGE